MSAKQGKPATRLPKARFFSVAVVVSDRMKSVEWTTKKIGLDLGQDLGHWPMITKPRGTADALIALASR